MKISAAYRNGKDGVGEKIALEALPLLRAGFGLDRLLWGSDWPHTQHESTVKYAAVRAQLDAWVPDAGDRKVVLADASRGLFRL